MRSTHFNIFTPTVDIVTAEHLNLVISMEISTGTPKMEEEQSIKLFHAVEEGILSDVIILLDGSVDVNVTNQDGCTPLHIAITTKNEEVFKVLVEKGANVNVANAKGVTPLNYAIWNKQLNMCKVLLQNGADVHLGSDWYGKPFFHAVKSEQFDIAKLLLDNGADINQIDPCAHYARSTQGTLLHWAARHDAEKVIKFLVENGADVNAVESDGRTALCLLAKHNGSLDNFKYLLEHGAEPNNGHGGTPLYWLIDSSYGSNRNLNKMKILIEKGADVNIPDECGRIPLHTATCLSYVQLLVKSGADVNAKISKSGQTSLYNANKLSIVKYLVENDADIHTRDNEGSTPLHYASSLRIAEFLVEKGADVNATNNHGYTPLDLAQNVSIAEFFIEKGTNFKALNVNGQSVLHSLAEADVIFNFTYRNVPHLVDYFIDKGVDVNVSDINGNTPLHICAESNNIDVARRLVTMGGNILARNNNGKTPEDGRPGIVSSMLKKNKQILFTLQEAKPQKEIEEILRCHDILNVSNEDDKSTLLHYAVRNCPKNIVQTILKDLTIRQDLSKSIINACDIHKWTPLHYAADRNNADIARLLLRHGAFYNAKTSNGKMPIELSDDEEIKTLFSTTDEFFECVKNGDNDRVSECIKKEGSIVNAMDSDGKSLLYWAVEKGHKNIVDLLLKKAVDITATTNENLTTVHVAVSRSDVEILEILLHEMERAKLCEKMMDVRTREGDTALHIATRNGSFECVKLLLSHGAMHDAKNKEYKTPRDVSINPDVSRYLTLAKHLFEFAEDGKSMIIDELDKMDRVDYLVLTNARNEEGVSLQQTVLSNYDYTVGNILSDVILLRNTKRSIIYKNIASKIISNDSEDSDLDLDLGFGLFD